MSSELKAKESSYQTQAYIVATVENTGSIPSGEISLTGRFYDGSGSLLESMFESLAYLKPGETWTSFVPYLSDGEKVASHTLDGEFTVQPPRFTYEAMRLAGTKLQKGEYSTAVVGTMQNEYAESIDYLGAVARFWEGDVIIGAGLDNVLDVPAGENWSFEAPLSTYSVDERSPNGYDVIPDVTIY